MPLGKLNDRKDLIIIGENDFTVDTQETHMFMYVWTALTGPLTAGKD